MNYTKKEPRLALFSKNNKKMIEEVITMNKS